MSAFDAAAGTWTIATIALDITVDTVSWGRQVLIARPPGRPETRVELLVTAGTGLLSNAQ